MRAKRLTLVHVFIFILALATQRSTSVTGSVYTLYPGYRLISPCSSGIVSGVATLSRCVARCSQVYTCVSGSYTEAGGACCVSDLLLYQDGAQFVADAGSTYFQTRADTVQHGNWTLVFRGSQGIGDSIYTEFLDTSRHDDHPVGGATAAISCWSLSGSHSCSRHLRSALLNSWAAGTLAVQKVRYSFYKNGAEVANIVFDGVGSDLTSWFSPSRIISSSYDDITPSQSFATFSVEGYNDGLSIRRFYVSKSHMYCMFDRGWMGAIEEPNCSWETFSTYPGFIYSPSSTCITWFSGGVRVADVMAVFVQL